jgi:Transposase DDE domain
MPYPVNAARRHKIPKAQYRVKNWREYDQEPVPVVMDSTGLKVYGAGGWQREKHGERGRRTWRQLHLAVDPHRSEILASELTTNEIGDPSMVSPLLDQIPGSLASVTADGAYDDEPMYRAIAARRPQLPPAVILPPQATAVLSGRCSALWQTQRPACVINTSRESRKKDGGVGRRPSGMKNERWWKRRCSVTRL